MPRNPQKRKQQKRQKAQEKNTLPQQETQSFEISPDLLAILSNNSPQAGRLLFEEALINASEFADEPEFLDFHFDHKITKELSTYWFERFEKKLSKAKIRGEEDAKEVLDQIKEKVFAQLITSEIREDIFNRLTRIRERYIKTKNTSGDEKIRILFALLQSTMIPWSVNGLLLSLYDRTITHILGQDETDIALYSRVAGILDEFGGADLEKTIKTPEGLDQLVEVFKEKDPGVLDDIEEMLTENIEEFESALMMGEVDLPLFSEKELMLSIQQIKEKVNWEEIEDEMPPEMYQEIIDINWKTLDQIMTPKRYRQYCRDIRKKFFLWQKENHPWGNALGGEMLYLEDTYTRSKFIFVSYFGQTTKRYGDLKLKI